MSTFNANDGGRPSDNRSLNRHNQSMTETGGRSGKTGAGKPYISGSNENRARSQTTWNSKEQRDVRSKGYDGRESKDLRESKESRAAGKPSGSYNRDNNDSKTFGYTKRDNSAARNNPNGNYTGRNDKRDAKPANYGTRDNGNTRPGGNGKPFKKPYGTYGKDSFHGGNGFRKDEDYESDNRRGKGHTPGGQRGDVKSKSSQGKEKDIQSDKMETIKRLEKEKKVLERKNQESEKEKADQTKPQMKKRRTGNIDWTKGYAKGRYGDDDEEDYTEYF